MNTNLLCNQSKTRTVPLNEVIWQCNWTERPVVSVPGSGHPHDIDTRCIDFLNRAPCRKKVESSSRIDFYRVFEMGHHQLMDGVHYAQLTMMSDNRRLCHRMTPRAGREQKWQVLDVKLAIYKLCKFKEERHRLQDHLRIHQPSQHYGRPWLPHGRLTNERACYYKNGVQP